MELAQLTKKRRDHIRSCRENEDNSHEIIAGLYSDPSHFIYELLQNADDAEASEVSVELTRDSILFKHNGRKLFDYKDIESITTVGSSTKKDDINAIGKYGAGFKSVFGVTSSPIIHSGVHHFKIVDIIVPEDIEAVNSGIETIIILPFNHERLSTEEAYCQISERLVALEAASLLFIRNIREVKWTTEEESGHYLSEIDGEKACIVSQRNNVDKITDYLLFRNNITIDNQQLLLAVAFELKGDEAFSIKPLHDTKLFVYFPTNEKTGLKFIVHAPYKTTPSRESIPFDDAQNQTLTNELSLLISGSILRLKDKGYLNIDLLNMLPIDKYEDHPVYRASFQQVKSILQDKDILPTSDGEYTKATNALLAREKELVTLLDSNDCKNLFDRNNWLSPGITYNKTRELRDYLIDELNITEVNMELFCMKITSQFMLNKSDEWIVDFYSSIITNKALYREKTSYQRKGILRGSPILRLENGSHISPEDDDDELQVYLPTEQNSDFKTVKRKVANNEKAREFLKALGLRNPDVVAEIKEFIAPKYTDNQAAVNKESYLNDFEKSFHKWSESDEYRQNEIIDVLSSLSFIGGVDSEGVFVTKIPSKVYFRTEKLELWFNGNDTDGIVFLDKALEKTEYRPFIEKLGVKSTLEITKGEDADIKGKDDRYIQRLDRFNPNLYIYGLDYSLKNLNLARSTMLWTLLLRERPQSLFGYTKKRRYLYEEFEVGERENSLLLQALIKNSWLYDKSSNLIDCNSVSEVPIDELHEDYERERNNVDKLIEALGLKLDEVKEFEEKTGKKVISLEDYKLLQKIKEEKNNAEGEHKLEEDDWMPEANPEDASIVVDDYEVIKRTLDNLAGQDNTGDADTNDEYSEEGDEEEPTKSSSMGQSKNSKAIGEWGEAIAKRYLENKYSEKEVVWLNENGSLGKGYDFVIREMGEEIYYYEVKSKTDEKPKLFKVTGTQWNWAKELQSTNRGNMYRILLVSNAGKKNPKINEIINPVELWKLGKVHADPVNRACK